MLYLLATSPSQLTHRPEDGCDLQVNVLEFEIPEWADMKATPAALKRMKQDAYDKIGEKIRQRYNLKGDHGTGVSDWLQTAGVGDTLLLPRTLTDNDDGIQLTCLGGSRPKLTRLVVQRVERVETTVKLLPLPGNVKKVPKRSKTDAKKTGNTIIRRPGIGDDIIGFDD